MRIYSLFFQHCLGVYMVSVSQPCSEVCQHWCRAGFPNWIVRPVSRGTWQHNTVTARLPSRQRCCSCWSIAAWPLDLPRTHTQQGEKEFRLSYKIFKTVSKECPWILSASIHAAGLLSKGDGGLIEMSVQAKYRQRCACQTPFPTTPTPSGLETQGFLCEFRMLPPQHG